MAAVFGRAAQRSVVSAARSSARRWHSLGGVERREANAAPRMRSGARRRAHSAFSAPSGPGVGQLRSMTWPRIACAQSLLPLHSATASARLVSRLSTFPELALLDGIPDSSIDAETCRAEGMVFDRYSWILLPAACCTGCAHARESCLRILQVLFSARLDYWHLDVAMSGESECSKCNDDDSNCDRKCWSKDHDGLCMPFKDLFEAFLALPSQPY